MNSAANASIIGGLILPRAFNMPGLCLNPTS